MKVRCLLVDDEPLAHKVIENYAAQLGFLEVVGNCYSGTEALRFLSKNQVDLMFLDMEMPGLNGTSLLRSLKSAPPVIMTTAFRDYAVESYEYDVVDFLLKPFSLERFVKAVQKVQVKNQIPAGPTLSILPKNEPIYVKSGFEAIRLEPRELLYIEGLKEYLRLHCTTGVHVVKASFKQAEESFPGLQLLRIHKSYMVAVHQIAAIRGSEVKVGVKWLPIGRSYKILVQQFLDEKLVK